MYDEECSSIKLAIETTTMQTELEKTYRRDKRPQHSCSLRSDRRVFEPHMSLKEIRECYAHRSTEWTRLEADCDGKRGKRQQSADGVSRAELE